MTAQPSRGDGEDAWRAYAGELRQLLGQASEHITALEAETKRLDQLLEGARRRRKSDRSTIVHVYRELLAGDTTAAIDRLAYREALRLQAHEDAQR